MLPKWATFAEERREHLRHRLSARERWINANVETQYGIVLATRPKFSTDGKHCRHYEETLLRAPLATMSQQFVTKRLIMVSQEITYAGQKTLVNHKTDLSSSGYWILCPVCSNLAKGSIGVESFMETGCGQFSSPFPCGSCCRRGLGSPHD